MAVLWTFREPSLGRHGHREFMRNAVLNLPLIIPATACHQRNDFERYSRYNIEGFWRVMKDTIGAGRCFGNLQELYQRTRQVLMAHQERPIYAFHW
jgi:hypothetical protein